jgi:hypothetical protein
MHNKILISAIKMASFDSLLHIFVHKLFMLMCTLEFNLTSTVYGWNPTPMCVLKCNNHWRMRLDLVDTDVKIYKSIKARYDEPIASENISFYRDIHCSHHSFLFLLPKQRLNIVKNIFVCIHTQRISDFVRTAYIYCRCYQITLREEHFYTDRER